MERCRRRCCCVSLLVGICEYSAFLGDPLSLGFTQVTIRECIWPVALWIDQQAEIAKLVTKLKRALPLFDYIQYCHSLLVYLLQ